MLGHFIKISSATNTSPFIFPITTIFSLRSISLGFALVAAADQKIDATPMEGFNNDQIDELLGLEKLGLKSAVPLALGYRDEEND